jgi:hypothetical protein
MDATTASGFLLAHLSKFYSVRGVVRSFVQLKTLPSVAELFHDRFAAGRAPQVEEALLAKTAAERLPALNRLCEENGSHFILVVPPTNQMGAETMVRVGRERHVTVWSPVAYDELDAGFFKADGFHLNDRGAHVFTTKLAGELRKLLIETNLVPTTAVELRVTTRQRRGMRLDGRITLDGIDLRDFSLETLRDNISMVFQNTFLFSIRDNIAFGRPDATSAEIVAAARASNAGELIE